jgi:RimJ/RimL family protein N-acetyltransferase
VTLDTERLVLRRPRLEDARAFDAFWQDEEASRFVGGTKTPGEVDRMMERTVRHWDWFGIGNFTVERREDGATLGRVGATEAALACRDWALGELGLTRLISLIALENTPSIRVAERIGESFERELENSPFRFPAGIWSLGERIDA